MANPPRIKLAYPAVWLALSACSGSTTGDSGASGHSAGPDAGAWQPAAPTGENQTRSATSGAGGSAKSAADAAGGGAAAPVQGGSGGGKAAAGGASGQAAGGGGAGGSSAGSGAAAGSGGAGTGLSGPTRCNNPDLLMCESFESGIDKGVWHTKLIAPTVDDMHAARGSKALHVHTGATSGSGIETSKLFSELQGHYYGRLFVYFDALPTSPAWAHWTIVGANPDMNSSDMSEIRVGGQFDGKLERWGVGTDHGPSGDWTNLDSNPSATAAKPVPLKQWLCVEWMHDWEHDETRFYLDGVENPSLHTTADVKHLGNANVKYDLPDLRSVWVGFWNYDQGKAVTPSSFDTWIDEVALDDERIGCDK